MDSFVTMIIRLHVIFMFSKCADCQVLSTCLLPIYNQECDMNCTTPDQSKLITFYKLPDTTNPVAQCLGTTCQISNTSLSTKYSIQSTDSKTTTFRIKNLSWDEKGTWRCDYDTATNTAVLGFAKYPDDIEYSGLSNNSEISSGTEMTITMKCLYTDISTSVTLIYLRDGGSVRSTPVSCTDATFSCANSNFVSKSCTPKVQLGSGVACGGNYSIEIAVSVLDNEEETYSAFTGIAITCTGGGGNGDGTMIVVIIVLIIFIIVVIIIIIIIIICCLLNKRCRSRYLRKDSKFIFTWPAKDIVVFDTHDKDFKIERPEGGKIEIQCLRTKEGLYMFDGQQICKMNGVKVRNSPFILFNPYIEIDDLKKEHEGLFNYGLKNRYGCSLWLEICNALVTVGKKDGSYVTIIKNSIKLKFIECKLSSIKLLKWKKSLLTDGTEIRELESTSNYELILSKMTKKDEGRYWCEVINNDGTSTNSGILTLHVVHDIVNVGLSSASCSATVGDSIQIRYTQEIIPQQIIFRAIRSGKNQIAPEPKVTKITDTASLFIEEISKEDEGCYLFASADGHAISGVLTLSVMEGNERYNTVYLGQIESGSHALQPRNGAKTFLDSIPKKEDIQENTDKKKRKKGKKNKKGKKEEEGETTHEEKEIT